MKILITNDDSVSAEQLVPFVRWARKLGDVTVVVPKHEQSGKSQSIQFMDPFEVKQVQLAEDVTVYTVDSSPADCVRFDVLGLNMKFDLVFSGINHGLNVARNIMYSGTAAGIFEAANQGIPAIALSIVYACYDNATKYLDEIWDYFQKNDLLIKHSLYNVNIARVPKGILITRQGSAWYEDEFPPLGNDMYQTSLKATYNENDPICYDIMAIRQNYISISPLTLERTDMAVYEDLIKLNP